MYSQIKICLQAGFTIIELIVVMAIVGVLLSIGIPAYTDLTRNGCLVTKTNDMITSMHLARSEAVKRRASVSLVAIDGSDADNEWGNGWRVVQGTAVNDTLIREFDAQCPATMNETNNNATVYTYLPNGFIAAAGEITVCDDRTGEDGRRIVINITGRPNLRTFGCQ